MNYFIRKLRYSDKHIWDGYVENHHQATLYHLSGWKNVIEKSYGLKTYYLMAINSSKLKAQSSKGNCVVTNQLSPSSYEINSGSVTGILPLVHLKHFIFGNNLISIPFFDFGGILADNETTEEALLRKAVHLCHEIGAKTIELRSIKSLKTLSNDAATGPTILSNLSHDFNPTAHVNCVTRSHKVRMILELPGSSEALLKSFKSKLRSQIKKPLKAGLYSRIGGPELLDDFYRVFVCNMRDLGSPVHSKGIIRNVLKEFQRESKLIVVYNNKQPLACSLVVGFNDTLENPWASSLRDYSRLAPNMLLYWTMLEYACNKGFRIFDFGRSSPGEGTFKFKKQWGAQSVPLNWHYLSIGKRSIENPISENATFGKAAQIWKKLPVPVTRFIGPRIRKYISL